jgi:arsenate reductase-like glutaredoxin family protein
MLLNSNVGTRLVGRARLINRQGTTWRRLPPADQALAETDAGALALLQREPTVIKRPVVRWPDGAVTVGFDATDWVRRLGVPGAG